MSRFRAGEFERARVPLALQRFCPHEALTGLAAVDLEALWRRGKRVLLLDVDNTLVPWRDHHVGDAERGWVDQAKTLGFRLCAVSNTHRPERLKALCEDLGIDYVRAKPKPSRMMFQMALRKYGVEPREAVMVGDQLLTDILGANRSGIDAIWVKPLAKKEFVGTKVFNRTVEMVLGRLLYRYFQPQVVYGDAQQSEGLFKHQIVKEFVKFAIVGGTSTLIDLGLHYWLMFRVRVGDTLLSDQVGAWALGVMGRMSEGATREMLVDAAYAPLKIGPVLIAIFNGYFWNSRWTFRHSSRAKRKGLIVKFYVVALVAMLVNLVVSTATAHALHLTAEKSWGIASVAGMIVAAFVNFTGQRMWTFQVGKK